MIYSGFDIGPKHSRGDESKGGGVKVGKTTGNVGVFSISEPQQLGNIMHVGKNIFPSSLLPTDRSSHLGEGSIRQQLRGDGGMMACLGSGSDRSRLAAPVTSEEPEESKQLTSSRGKSRRNASRPGKTPL